jgi:23S rRNA (cytosine1962-C5)-methyltransferase
VRDPSEAVGGAIVRAVDEAGNFVGQAFYSDRSEIALRFLTTHEQTIDREWWRGRLRQCAESRSAISRETNAYRLVYSEGDLLPSLIVDVYDNVMVLQTLSQGTEKLKSMLTELLAEEFTPRAVIERNEARVREFEGLEFRSGVVYGDAVDEVEINQHGIRFVVAPLGGQKTGAFLDQRENYLAARSVAHGRALDCFTFNGGFALHLAASCESVLAIDISGDAVVAAQRNAELNEVGNIEFRTANVFDALREMEFSGERFDTIVLDPPAFAKTKSSVPAALRGYKEINLRAFHLLSPGGVLVTASCSFHIDDGTFERTVLSAAADAGRSVQVIERRGAARDHPTLLGVPETRYLKCLILRVL